ncbi:MAG: hypothetical protein H9533_07765 [Rhodobacteraceae bacterium]|nr:hypothetical protein [Paracoccaceae bacterium]
MKDTMVGLDRADIVFQLHRPTKTGDQKAKAVLFHGRTYLFDQRAELLNAVRTVLNEYGYVFPVGFGHVKRIAAVLCRTTNKVRSRVASPDNVPVGSCRCISQLFLEIFALLAARFGRFAMTPVV